MATTGTVLDAVRSQVQTAMQGLTFGFGPPLIGVGWPDRKTLEDQVAKGNGVVVAVYDRSGGATDATRWLPYPISDTITAPGVQVALSQTPIYPGASSTITLSGTVTANDAVALQAQNGRTYGAAVIQAGNSDTPASLATALAAAINADATLSLWLTATAAGAVVTVYNTTASSLAGSLAYQLGGGGSAVKLTALSGNNGQQYVEYRRDRRQLQLVFWCPNEPARRVATDPVHAALAQLYVNFGIQILAGPYAGEWIRVEYNGDSYVEREQLKSLYRRDFFITCDYSVSAVQTAYPVLVNPITQQVTVGTQLYTV